MIRCCSAKFLMYNQMGSVNAKVVLEAIKITLPDLSIVSRLAPVMHWINSWSDMAHVQFVF